MTAIRTLFADPTVERVDGTHGTWLLAGVDPGRLRGVVADAPGLREVTDVLASVAQDAVVAFVSGTDRGGRVEAYRSATSSRDVFFLEASDGTFVLTDHFRNAVSQLDPADRSVPRRALVDHLLFRSPVEPLTYVDQIGRLGRGECLSWNGDDREWSRTLVDTLAADDRTDRGGAVDALDDALASVLDATNASGTMLSGGVDSTLLATYLEDPAPVQFAVDSPEFDPEVEAGADAADHLDVDRTVHTVPESAFREHLEATVDVLGRPPRYNQTVFTAAAVESLPAGRYVNGQAADALFGLPGVSAARVADWLDPLLSRSSVDRAASLLPGNLQGTYDALDKRRRQLDRPVASPRSFANALSADLDVDAVSSLFDRRTVRRRTRRRTAYATDRVDVDADEGFARQVAVGQLTDFLCDDAVNRWRQAGFAAGIDVFAPFRTRDVARAALSVPADRRYVEGRGGAPKPTTKHVPKRLLSNRLPSFPVNRRKHSGSLPIERYVDDGPLADVFERYDPPAFLTPESRDRHVDAYGSLTWELVTYAVWRDRVLLADDLEPVPGTETRYLRLPHDPASPV